MYHLELLLVFISHCYGLNPDKYYNYSVDNMANITNTYISFNHKVISLPKCCPFQSVYDSSRQTCVTFKQTRFMVSNTTLSKCEVILDQIFSKNQSAESVIQVDENGTINYNDSKYTVDKYCLDNTTNTDLILKLCLENDICDNRDDIICIKKCCPYENVLFSEDDADIAICKPDNSNEGFNLELQSNLEAPKKFGIRPINLSKQQKGCSYTVLDNNPYKIDNEGVLFQDLDLALMNFILDTSQYCMDRRTHNNNTQQNTAPVLHMCIPNHEQDWTSEIPYYAYTISGLFMLFTMVYYCVMYKLEKLIHKIVFSFCLAYVIGPISYYVDTYGTGEVARLSLYVFTFETYSSSMWLNIMSYDMWNSLRSMKSNMGDLKLKNMKTYICYSLYGWVLPLVIVLIYYEEVNYRNVMEFFHLPRKHFFAISWIIPNFLLTVVNLVFYGLTVYHIISAKNNIRQMTSSLRDSRKEMFTLYTSITLKLFLLMGLTRAFAIFYSLFNIGDKNKILDVPYPIMIMEALEGVTIFFTLVLRWNTIKNTVCDIYNKWYSPHSTQDITLSTYT